MLETRPSSAPRYSSLRNSLGIACLVVLVSACGSQRSSPTPPIPAVPQVLPQAPTSCTFRTTPLVFEDRVAAFFYDVRWFPPQESGSATVTSYELEIRREAVQGTIGEDGYSVTSSRPLPTVYKNVPANPSTTTVDLHTAEDAVTFPICEFIAAREDLYFFLEVRAVSSVGKSMPTVCVDADRLWEGIVVTVSARDSNRTYYEQLCRPETALRLPYNLPEASGLKLRPLRH